MLRLVKYLLFVLILVSPAWGQVEKTLFAQGFNTTTSPWCPVDGNEVDAQIYVYRLWDDKVKLSQIFTTSLTPDWTTLDDTINNRAGGGDCPGTPMKVIYTFGATPQWASNCSTCANPSTSLPGLTSAGYGGGTGCANTTAYSCLPFSDVNADGTGADAIFGSMVSQIVARYIGKIAYYEHFNEADSPNFSCYQGLPVVCGGGNPNTTANVPQLQRLVRQSWDAYNIEKCIDPASKSLSPSFHVGTALTWFHFFNITSINAPAGVAGVNGVPVGCNWPAKIVTGKMTYDYANIHPRGTPGAYPIVAGNWNTAAIITAYNNATKEIANDGLPNPTVLFGDELGYNSAIEGGNNVNGYTAYIMQIYIFCSSLNFYLCGWYQWDTPTIGVGGTQAATGYDTLANWLIGNEISSYTLTGSVYTFTVTLPNGEKELIAWDSSQTCNPSCTYSNQEFAGYTTYYDFMNSLHAVDGNVALGTIPILLVSGLSPPTDLTVVVTGY